MAIRSKNDGQVMDGALLESSNAFSYRQLFLSRILV
jgi:hypothetical protein